MSAQGEQADHAHVLIRPPRLYGIAAVVGAVLHYLVTLPFPADAAWRYGGYGLILLGFALAFIAIAQFHRAGTNGPTTQASSALVTHGIYRHSRNPIYIGLTAIYLGIALAIGSVWSLAFLVPVLAVMEFGVIRREERYLTDKFGDAYTTYRSKVRRWL
jgi:protein-S-isoprenylcysteine O-methyltransferase Ste14